jgi:hypothetical protein
MERLVPVFSAKRKMTVRLADVPALFSEGPEPDQERPAPAWPSVEFLLMRLSAFMRGAARR